MKKKPNPKGSFAENLAVLMAYHGYSDASLARDLGLSRASVWRWRSGKREPRALVRAALAKLLDCTIGQLYWGA